MIAADKGGQKKLQLIKGVRSKLLKTKFSAEQGTNLSLARLPKLCKMTFFIGIGFVYLLSGLPNKINKRCTPLI